MTLLERANSGCEISRDKLVCQYADREMEKSIYRDYKFKTWLKKYNEKLRQGFELAEKFGYNAIA